MNAIVCLNKPSGTTSHQAVARIKRLLRVRKAGHTGTLDPLATGLLLVCLNEATKISRFLLNMDKKYRARIKLGERTDTYDSDGAIIEKSDISSLTEDRVVETVMMFTGAIRQRPPMYSALKIGGQKLYELARKGLEIERQERTVQILGMEITEIDFPYVELAVTCSKGTYIRTLCDDIGKMLGTGAHLVALERVGIGPFKLSDAATYDDLERETSLQGERFICEIETALAALAEVSLDGTDYKKAKNGLEIIYREINGLGDGDFVRLKGPEGNLFAIGRINSDRIRIERILHL